MTELYSWIERYAAVLHQRFGSVNSLRWDDLAKLILQFLGATLVAASLMQTAVAAEHRRRYADRAPVSAGKQSRNASNQVVKPSLAEQNFEYWQALGRAAGGASALRLRGN